MGKFNIINASNQALFLNIIVQIKYLIDSFFLYILSKSRKFEIERILFF